MVSRRVVRKPFLNWTNRRKRVLWARKFKSRSVQDWKKVIFSDEKLFRLVPGGHIKCWRAANKGKFEAKYLNNVVQRPEALMVWCAINGSGRLILKRCPKKVKAGDYQRILQSALHFIKPRCETLWETASPFAFSVRASGYRFQQDGAPPHRAVSTKRWLQSKGVRMHNGGQWPANSPDMNIIEHVWPFVNRKIAGRMFPNKDVLWAALQQAFGEVTPQQIQNLYASLPDRCKALLKAKGGPTRY